MKKRIYLTGANGLLGTEIRRRMDYDRYDLLATSRKAVEKSPRYQTEALDMTDEKALMESLEAFRPETILHTAAISQIGECEENKGLAQKINTDVLRTLIAYAEKSGAFLIHLSTDFIFDGLKEGEYTEEDAPRPVNFYGQTKVEAEKLLRESKCRNAIVRTVLVYGNALPQGRSNLVHWVKSSLEQQKTIRVVTDQRRTATYVGDLAVGCLLLAEKQTEGVFNLCGADGLSPYEIAIKTGRFYGLDENLVQKALAEDFDDGLKRPVSTCLSIIKAANLLGYKPRTFEESLKDMSFFA